MTNLLISVPASMQLALRRVARLFVGLMYLSAVFMIFSSAAYAQPIDIGSGTLDDDKVTAPRWTRINFAPLITGDHTITINSDASADIRFSVFQIADAPAPDNKVLIGTSSISPTVADWTGSLDLTEQYYLGVWAASGSGSYTATIEAQAVGIVSQPTYVTVTEGNDATFTVAAVGSGTLTYQWYVNDQAITGATTDTYSVITTSTADDGNVYRVDVTDTNGTLSSDSAVLTVEAFVFVPVTVANIGQGIVDADKIAGPRWVRIDFDSLSAATHTVAVSWDSGADVRFKVFEADGTLISPVIQGAIPGVWSGALEANTQKPMFRFR